MRRTSLLGVTALLLSAAVTWSTAPPAQAAVETTEILVTNNYGGSGCAYNQRLLVANPFTGALVANLGTPNSSLGVLNEAKPYDGNRKIVALWAGSTDFNQANGVAVYDRVAGSWSPVTPLTGFQMGGMGAHSVTILPDGYYAVAQTGSINGSGSGWIVVVRPSDGALVDQEQLASAHGVEWDAARQRVFAVGYTELRRYTYDATTHQLAYTGIANTLPTTGGVPGGHDLRRRRTDDSYFVTTNQQGHVFDPDTGVFTTLTVSGGGAIGGYVKSLDQRFDGVTEYSKQYDNYFRFTDRPTVTSQFCMSGYKAGRWLYPVETTDPDPDPTPQPCATGTSEWAQEGEAFTDRAVGGLGTDAGASGGQFWNVWANGTISTTLNAATTGPKRVTVTAKGNSAGGIQANMRVLVDGVEVLATTVTGSWAPYSAAVSLAAGAHTLGVQFTNDGFVGTEDRNLHVDVAASAPASLAWAGEAELFPTKTAGGEVTSAGASGGKYWNLWSNGHIEGPVTVPCTSRHELHVLARGDVAGGIWPQMKVYLDGTLVLTQTVDTTTWTAYKVRRSLSGGTSTLRIEFTNDAVIGTEDRNLKLDIARLYT